MLRICLMWRCANSFVLIALRIRTSAHPQFATLFSPRFPVYLYLFSSGVFVTLQCVNDILNNFILSFSLFQVFFLFFIGKICFNQNTRHARGLQHLDALSLWSTPSFSRPLFVKFLLHKRSKHAAVVKKFFSIQCARILGFRRSMSNATAPVPVLSSISSPPSSFDWLHPL